MISYLHVFVRLLLLLQTLVGMVQVNGAFQGGVSLEVQELALQLWAPLRETELSEGVTTAPGRDDGRCRMMVIGPGT